MYLDKDKILGTQALKYKDVEVPELGGVVRLQELTAASVHLINKMREDGADWLRLSAAYLALSAVKDNGKHVFVIDDVDDIMQMSYRVLNDLTTEVLEISGLKDTEPGN